MDWVLTKVWGWGGLAAPLLLDPPPVVDHLLGDFDDPPQSAAEEAREISPAHRTARPISCS